jgi:dimeric dUTPase (all-alpha-NTP-PPase superfamily)
MVEMHPLLINAEHLKRMLVMQEELNVKYNGENWREKVQMTKVKFAILDETSEFLREIESTWKWWKHDPVYNRQKALYELIDIIHFALVVVLLKFDLSDINIYIEEHGAHATQFGPFSGAEAYEEYFNDALVRFLKNANHYSDLDDIITVFCNLVQAGGELIGVTDPNEIFTAYVMKNNRNHQRVDGGVMEGKYDKSKESDVPS